MTKDELLARTDSATLRGALAQLNRSTMIRMSPEALTRARIVRELARREVTLHFAWERSK